MSQENVDFVKAAFEAWNAGDMDAVFESFDPEIVARTPEGWPEPGPFVGREAAMRQYRQLRGTFEADQIELVSDFVDIGDRVAVRMIWHGMGRGPESSLEWTCVYTIRKGKILNIDYFWDHAEALEAVGVAE